MTSIIQTDLIESLLQTTYSQPDRVLAILSKARQLQGLTLEESALLIQTTEPDLVQQIFQAAQDVKQAIYGNRIVFFAPLYISNYCQNVCLYCAFKRDNSIHRHALNSEEIQKETDILLRQGHKRILLVSGESYPAGQGLDYILNAIDTIYQIRYKGHNIRRINANIAPLETEEFRRLKAHNIGTYQLFQETYHPVTYSQMHVSGAKADYHYRLSAIDRAFEAGIDDVGVGVLYGLHDWRFETLGLLSHIHYLEKKFGLGPHTISVPRIEPAEGSYLSEHIPHIVSDEDFKKAIAILRLSVPYTGLILSTRETPELRRQALHLGVSQISAGSRTNPGGYTDSLTDQTAGQFSLGDHRSLPEVVADLLEMGFMPSFCTACYRLGRTGLDFMEYAKPGDIRKKCEPNAMMTFLEFLQEFADDSLREAGHAFIRKTLEAHPDPKIKAFLQTALTKISMGEKDIFV